MQTGLNPKRKTRPPGRLARGSPQSTSSSDPSKDSLSRRFGQALDKTLPGELPVHLLALLVLASFLLRMLWLTRPEAALIFDEKYYVNSARVIAGIPPGQDVYQDNRLGLDPNTEHPPLAKVIVAGSILQFGDNAFAWRFPSVLFGTASILLMYGIARRLGASQYMALLAAGLLAFDNLVFVHSRIFTLDIFQLGFMLLGLYLYLSNRLPLAGVGFALATLCKIGGLFGLFAIIGYEMLRLWRGRQPWRLAWRAPARRLAVTCVTFGVVFLLLLGLMDRIWVGYNTPFEHLQRIFSYGTVLRRSVPSGIESYPWQWLWNEKQIPYINVEQQVKVGEEVRENRSVILFLGAMNPYVLQLLPLGLAFAVYAWWRRRPTSDLGAMALAWFVAMYLPFVAASVIGQRISYLFYFLPTLPAVALAGAHFLMGSSLPRIVIWVYLAAVLLGFYGYFPFKLMA